MQENYGQTNWILGNVSVKENKKTGNVLKIPVDNVTKGIDKETKEIFIKDKLI